MTRTLVSRPYRTVNVDSFRDFDSLVRQAFGPSATGGFQPAAEVTRDGDDAVVRLELPGVDVASDVHVEVKEHRLVLTGERRDERAEQTRGIREFRYGSFSRSFRLPAHVTADDVTASYDAGVLAVRIAGAHASSPAQQITISTGATPAEEAPAEGVAPVEGEAPEVGSDS